MLTIHVDGFEMKRASEFLMKEDDESNERYLHRIIEPSVERLLEHLEKVSCDTKCEYEVVRQTTASVLSDVLYTIITDDEKLALVRNILTSMEGKTPQKPEESIPSGLEGLEVEIISVDNDCQDIEGV